MAEKNDISRVETHSPLDDSGRSFFESSARNLWNAIGDLAHSAASNTANWHLPILSFNFDQLLPGDKLQPAAPASVKDSVIDPIELELAGDAGSYKALQDVCLALDNAQQLKSRSSVERGMFDQQPALTVKQDGSIERNSQTPAGSQVLIEFETGADGILSLEQKAAARDLLSYMRMHNPGADLPAIWSSYLDDTLPPPVMLDPPSGIQSQYPGSGASRAPGTDSVSSEQTGYRRFPGLRSHDGGGFSGSGGKAHSIIPEGIAHSGKTMDIHTDKTGKLVDSLELHKFVDKVVHAVSGNEGQFTSINPNDAGYGISVGIRQWNQKVGELPHLLKAMHQHNPEKFEHIFGSYSQKMLDESWVRNYHMAGDKNLMNRMDTALHQKDFQHVQVNLAREFVKSSIKLAYQYGLKSELGLALVCDMVNQTGRGGTEAALKRSGLHKGADIGNEHHAVHTLAHSTDRAGGHHRFIALAKNFSAEKHAVV